MKIFWIIFITSMIPGCIIPLFSNKNNLKKANQVYYSISLLAMLLIGVVLIFWGMIYAILKEIYDIIPALTILGLPLVFYLLHCAFWQISFFEDYWLFRRKKYLYEDITKVVFRKNGGCSIFVGKKKIKVDFALVNYNTFVEMLKKKKVFKLAEIIHKN